MLGNKRLRPLTQLDMLAEDFAHMRGSGWGGGSGIHYLLFIKNLAHYSSH